MAGFKEEDEVPESSSDARIPLLWSSLIETGLAEVQQSLGNIYSRRWLHVDQHGVAALVEVDKHRVVQELGIRYRDLLVIDPTVPTPSPVTLLVRERALVANLEAVRMIVCANQCFVLSVPKASDARVAAFPTLDNPFVLQLCKCLRTGKSTANLHGVGGGAAFDFDAPYELRALEVGLATATNILDREVYDLERAAMPAIDQLARCVSREVLEEVRQVKQSMGKLMGRVQRLKQELEELLEDDMDMADMYLGRRALLAGEELPRAPLGRGHSHASLADADGGRAASHHDLPHPGSASSLAPHHAAPPAAGHGERTHGMHRGGSGVDVLRPAAEHLSHHVRDRGSDGSAHGHRTAAKQHWQRSGTVVRTVRTLRRRKPKAAAAGAAAAGAAAGGAPDEGQLTKSDSAPPDIAVDDAGSGDSDGGSSDGEDVIETFIEQPAMPAVDPHDIEDAEDLLESYFVQADYVLRRLMAVNERIDDVEDLVSIEMDHRRNELVATDLMVTIVACGLGFWAVIAGVFGMNLHAYPQTRAFFWAVIGVTTALAMALVGGIVWWIHKRRLLFVARL